MSWKCERQSCFASTSYLPLPRIRYHVLTNRLSKSASTRHDDTPGRSTENIARKSPSKTPRPLSDVVIIGGGAAGLTAAWWAAETTPHARILVLERNDECGRKILISGGTRANVLPARLDIDLDLFTDSRRAALKAILESSEFNLEACYAWISTSLGIPLALETETNKYFPTSNSSRQVRDQLLKGCLARGVRVKTVSSVEGLRRVHDDEEDSDDGDGDASSSSLWELTLKSGDKLLAQRVIFAAGGKSFPSLGTDGTGHRLLASLNQPIHPIYPALTPLTGTSATQHLAGVSLQSVQATCDLVVESKGKKSKSIAAHRGGFLFTHRGYSGPSVLDLSHHIVKALETKQLGTEEQVSSHVSSPVVPAIRVSWTRQSPSDVERLLTPSPTGTSSGSTLLLTLLRTLLPTRLAETLLTLLSIPMDTNLAQLTKADRIALVNQITSYRLDITGHEGYGKAEVTGGGVPLTDVNARTMELRKSGLEGLHVCGEMLDVFGRIGGFNFYLAWVTGRAAGIGAAQAWARDEAAARAGDPDDMDAPL